MTSTVKINREKYEGEFAGKFLDQSDYDQVLPHDKNCEVIGPNGELLAVVIRKAIPMNELALYWKILRKVNLTTNNRGLASGDTTKNVSVKSGIFGYYPRYPRIPFCRECAWNADHPSEYKQLLPLFKKISELHEKHCPESYQIQKEWIEKTSQDFVIKDTVYTTVTINKNFRTASHLDAKNLMEGMAPMLLMRSGQFTGGDVILPEWRVATKLGQGDLIFFRNMKDYHGNAPIVPISEDYQRCTLIFYYRSEMSKCGTAAQELERAKSGLDYSKDFQNEC